MPDRPLDSEPRPGHLVEILDGSNRHISTAIVEATTDEACVLRLDAMHPIPEEARVRWFDGTGAWQAIVTLSPVPGTAERAALTPLSDWEQSGTRRAARAPVDKSPLLVRVIQSASIAKGRRIHAVCLDVSQTGCRASWPGRAPTIGDTCDLAWDLGDWDNDIPPGWVNARVMRIVNLPFGARQVGFQFTAENAEQSERIEGWHENWMQAYRVRLLSHKAA